MSEPNLVLATNIAMARVSQDQEGVLAQSTLFEKRLHKTLARVGMLTGRQVGVNAGSNALRPERRAAQWRRSGRIFAVRIEGKGLMYPGFQFQSSGLPWHSLSVVLPILLGHFSAESVLLWFETSHTVLCGRRPASCLQNTKDLLNAVAETVVAIQC